MRKRTRIVLGVVAGIAAVSVTGVGVLACAANLGDYIIYRRAQRRLKALQASLAGRAGAEER